MKSNSPEKSDQMFDIIERQTGKIKRKKYDEQGIVLYLDEHLSTNVHFCFFYVNDIRNNNYVRFPDNFNCIVENLPGAGYELPRINLGCKSYYVWLPQGGTACTIEPDGRILTSDSVTIKYKFNFDSGFKIHLLSDSEETRSAALSCVLIPDDSVDLINQLKTNDETENRRYRKSNWFDARSPLDIWKYLIHGSIYDPRTHPSIGKRFKCQQCANAWWTYFNYLYTHTRKDMYRIIRDEIAFSVANDLNGDGAWRHGFWSDDMDIHSRFQLDGIHLLISQSESDGDPVWIEYARKAMDYVIQNLTDRFEDGTIWFLHDSIEDKRNHKFYSTIYGKNKYNSLCINTHVQALCVLRRLMNYDDKGLYRQNYNFGNTALRRIMEESSGAFLYKIIVNILLFPKNKSESKSHLARLPYRAAASLASRFYWRIKERYPRIVLPGGFIERDLDLSMLSDRYHVINVKDLLVLYRLSRQEWLIPYIKNGVDFLHRFIEFNSLSSALNRSPYYIEYHDILILYNALIAPVPAERINNAKNQIMSFTDAVSLDSHAESYLRNDI